MLTRKHSATDGTRSKAVYSDCELYRYDLTRSWGDDPMNRIVFIGLNPSTATEVQNDPTVARCIRYAQDWGYDAMTMLNAFAYRSTDPAKLRRVADPVGKATDQYIRRLTGEARLVLLCWGTHAVHLNREAILLEKLLRWDRPLYCLKLTQAGHPSHPLYLRKDLQPLPFQR